MKTKIGILGNGYVGKATALLKCEALDFLIYDIDPLKCDPSGTTLEDLKSCDFIFVCVPTPMEETGEPVISIVQDALQSLAFIGYDQSRVILKSTVPVGTSESFGVMFMPEFLTEKNWENDFKNQKHWILGTNTRDDKLRDEIYNIFSLAYEHGSIKNKPEMLYCTTQEAEVIKYTRNCYLATKVSFFNEIHDFCHHHHLSYDKVRQLVCLDDRIEQSHTFVPGHDGLLGYGGTCFPKDMNSLLHQMKATGMTSYIIKSAIDRNQDADRPQRDWLHDKGRAVV